MGRSIDRNIKQKIPSEYCYYCGRKLNHTNLSYDHVFPVQKGGQNNENNLVACCIDCNQTKKNYTLYELVRELKTQKKFCDNELRTATLDYQIKIFSLAIERRKQI